MAEKWYPPGGPYQVLVRLENSMGCGAGGIASCYLKARAAFKLLQSEWFRPDISSMALPQCPSAAQVAIVSRLLAHRCNPILRLPQASCVPLQPLASGPTDPNCTPVRRGE